LIDKFNILGTSWCIQMWSTRVLYNGESGLWREYGLFRWQRRNRLCWW